MSLIRMNLYRFIRTKTVYVLLLITVAIISLVILDQTSGTMPLDEEILQQAGVDADNEVGLTFGVSMITSVPQLTVEMLGSGILLVFTAIFAAIFSNSERAGGYLKNLNSCAGAKEQIFLGKIVPVMVFALLNLWIVPLAGVLVGAPMGLQQTAELFSGKFILYMTVQWMLHVAYGIFVLMIMELTRSLLAGILVGIFAGMGVGVMMISFVENIFRANGAITGHMLVYMIRIIAPENMGETLMMALLTATISIVLYMGIGALTFKTRDY